MEYIIRTANELDLRAFCERGVYQEELSNGQVRRIAKVYPNFDQCADWMLKQALDNIEQHFIAVGIVGRFNESLWHFHDMLAWRWPPIYQSGMDRSKKDNLDDDTRRLIE